MRCADASGDDTRGAAAVRPALVGRAAAHLPTAPRPAHRAQHERRRDVAHRSRCALRRRRRHRPDLPLQPPSQGPTVADRAGVPGVGEPTCREVRAGRPGHLHPAVQRGRLRCPPGVHRAGDPAHQPGFGHPADDGDRPRRRCRLPVHRAARLGRRPRRLSPARGAGRHRAGRPRRRPPAHPDRTPARPTTRRPASRPDGPRGRPSRLRARSAGDRRSAVDPGSPRAPPRRTRPGRRCAPPLRRRRVGPAVDRRPVGLPARRAAAALLQPVPQAVPCRVRQLPPGARVAGPVQPAAPRRRRPRCPPRIGSAPRGDVEHRPSRCTSTDRCSPGCCRTSGSATAIPGSSVEPAARRS